MTVDEWYEAIRESMNDGLVTGLDGRTRYDILNETLREMSNRGEAGQFLDAFLRVADISPRDDIQWWNRLFNLLENFTQLSQQHKIRLIKRFEPECDVSDGVRAIMLRQLAAYGIELNWTSIEQQVSFKAAVTSKPVFIADALAWAGKISKADDTLAVALAKGLVDQAAISRINQRWRDNGIKAKSNTSALVEDIALDWFKEPSVYAPVLQAAA
ncbi:hypothetical protein [Rhizobium leguminosarum]|uniref:hypothetical protein n=1 Tax=Rhizobium leguminosarum TaxID=384 RepID=UPI003F9AAF06